MKRLWICFLLIGHLAYSQDEVHVVNQMRSLKIQPVLQSWKLDDTGRVNEISIPFEIYYSFNRWWSVDVAIGQASASGKDLTAVSGLSDTQVMLNYYLESSNMVFNLGMNLPSGKKELKVDEFNTTSILSQNMLRFMTPIFGQGFNISPGLTWALPASETVVLGFGASYQFKGGYKPISEMTDLYKPGDEVLVTAGVDARTGEAESFSFDLIYTHYNADKLGSDEIFHSGGKIMAAAQYQKYIGMNLLWLFLRYQSQSKNYVILSGTSAEARKIQPDELEWRGLYRLAVSKQINWIFSAEIRSLQKTEVYDRVNVLGLGVGLDWMISPSFKIPLKIAIGLGRFGNQKNLTGMEIGAGFEYTF